MVDSAWRVSHAGCCGRSLGPVSADGEGEVSFEGEPAGVRGQMEEMKGGRQAVDGGRMACNRDAVDVVGSAQPFQGQPTEPGIRQTLRLARTRCCGAPWRAVASVVLFPLLAPLAQERRRGEGLVITAAVARWLQRRWNHWPLYPTSCSLSHPPNAKSVRILPSRSNRLWDHFCV